MKPGRKSKPKLIAALALLFTASACKPGMEHPSFASDFCLADQRVEPSISPVAGADDPGNQHDSEPTVLALFAHNEVHDRLCPPAG
jgi:hypothetical protein